MTVTVLAAGVAVGVVQGLIPWPPRLSDSDATGGSARGEATEAAKRAAGGPRGEDRNAGESRRNRPSPGGHREDGGRRGGGSAAAQAVSFAPLWTAAGRFAESIERPPTVTGVRAARRYIDRREGEVSFAALAPGKDLLGHRVGQGYPSASLSKAMLLVARLRQLGDDGSLDEATREQLESMITVSDNDAADAVYSIVGDSELDALAVDAGMTSFEPTYWPDIALTPADQARFFLRIERLVPGAHRRYALELLSSIAPEQSWGIPEASEPRWRAFFKGGWRPEGDGWIVHQGARLEDRAGHPVGVAVLSRGNPSYEYGQATIEGIAERILGRD
jgi:hypothetical protein